MNPFSKFKNDFQGKRVLIFGLGLLGRGADVARVFAQIGSKVTVTDRKSDKQLKPSLDKLKGLPIKYTLGKHKQNDIDTSQVIVRNPDVEWHTDLLDSARHKKIPIVMDTSLFARYFQGTLVGITGTRGKTTTTNMIYEIIKKSKKDVMMGGNATDIANLRFLTNSTKETIVVSELSSWELQGFAQEKISPQIAVVTNIYEDHLDHYKDFNEYVKDKQAIFTNQTQDDYLILNKKNSWTKKMGKKAKSKVIWFSEKNLPFGWKLRLLGKHNIENAAAAYEVGKLLNLKKRQMKTAFAKFSAVKHRLEVIKEINSVLFINDTTSTTPVATIKAIQAMTRPIVLLVGGNDKNLSLKDLAKEIVKNVKAVVFLKGSGTRRIKKEINKIGTVEVLVDNLPFIDAIKKAFKKADKGDVILLSPGFTSFGEFNNIFERGDVFKKIINNISD